MIFNDLKQSLDTNPAQYVLKYLPFDVQPKKTADMVGQKIWEYYLKNETLHYGTNIVHLAEVGDWCFSHFQTKLLYNQFFLNR
jgi:hypothetical protein